MNWRTVLSLNYVLYKTIFWINGTKSLPQRKNSCGPKPIRTLLVTLKINATKRHALVEILKRNTLRMIDLPTAIDKGAREPLNVVDTTTVVNASQSRQILTITYNVNVTLLRANVYHTDARITSLLHRTTMITYLDNVDVTASAADVTKML
jgi:hypothetical protein